MNTITSLFLAHKKLKYRHEHIKLNKYMAISFKKSNKQQKSSCLNIYAAHKHHIISRNLEPVCLVHTTRTCTVEVLR
jgi:hypothetical protein